jgi:hypothetical protein
MNRPKNTLIIGLAILALVLAGWLILEGPAKRGDEPLTVAAAANLQFAFT